MIALTTQDINVAYFIAGALSSIVGAGIIAFFRWRREDQVEPAPKTELIAQANRAALITPTESGLDDLMADLLADSMRAGVER